MLAPIEQPGKYLAIGMNYAKHVAEADKLGVARSNYQVWFNKQTTCISGPHDLIVPGVTAKLDYASVQRAVDEFPKQGTGPWSVVMDYGRDRQRRVQ